MQFSLVLVSSKGVFGGNRQSTRKWAGYYFVSEKCQREFGLFFFVSVPIFMQRILAAPQTRRPSPMMAAARTSAACVEGVPFRSAAAKILRRASVAANPSAGGIRSPFALRTADAAEFRFVVDFLQGLFNLVRRHIALAKKRERQRQFDQSAKGFLVGQHLLPSEQNRVTKQAKFFLDIRQSLCGGNLRVRNIHAKSLRRRLPKSGELRLLAG